MTLKKISNPTSLSRAKRLNTADDLTSSLALRVYRYWESKCIDGKLPLRSTIDPLEIPDLMQYLIMVDLENEPFRVRYRLVGTHVVDINGYEFTNRYLDEMTFTMKEFLIECYQHVYDNRCACFAYYDWIYHEARPGRGNSGSSEIGIFPLVDESGRVYKALAVEDGSVRQRSE